MLERKLKTDLYLVNMNNNRKRGDAARKQRLTTSDDPQLRSTRIFAEKMERNRKKARLGLQNPVSRKWDAWRIADVLEISHAEFTQLLGKERIDRTDNDRLQVHLQPYAKLYLLLLNVFGSKGEVLRWLNTQHSQIPGHSPMDIIRQGRIDIVQGLLDNAFEGLPA